MSSSSTSNLPSIFSRNDVPEESSVDKDLAGLKESENKEESEDKEQHNELVGVVCPPLPSPASAYEGYRPPYPISKEWNAVNTLFLQGNCAQEEYGGSRFVSFVLDDYTIYNCIGGNGRRVGMVPLDDVANKEGGSTFFFDGIIRPEGEVNPDVGPFYLQRISFSIVSLGGYEDPDQHTVGEHIWIQSIHCQKKDIWYRLGKPSAAYEPYQQFFSWLADLAKHFVDYLHADQERDVTLNHFREDFHDWLLTCHGENADFIAWLAKYGSRDFRHAVNAHGRFLQGQAFTISLSSYGRHTLWDELGLSGTPIITPQPTVVTNTVVTPFVYECFKKMPWSSHLQKVELAPEVKSQHKVMVRRQSALLGTERKTSATGDISVGDVVALRKDDESIWKGKEDYWYALVQGFGPNKHRDLRLIWLYRASDTVCANMAYPHSNELFLSDHCDCKEGKRLVQDVVKKVSVEFFSFNEDRDTSTLFVRQIYQTKDETFRTLHKSDFSCRCGLTETPTQKFKAGDTVLAQFANKLKPAEVISIGPEEATLRVFLYRRDLREKNCRPNELVYCDDSRTIPVSRIKRHCHIRVFKPIHIPNIPCPYNRDGTGDAFYIIYKKDGENLIPLNSSPSFKEGFDPSTSSLPKLKALNLFSGGGTFDRGLEEGGAIESKWAVEWGLQQMLTYRANHPDAKGLKLFCGSVNDYLFQAITGKENTYVARIGDVHFISAGSPCQGYSSANAHKENEISMRNSSMIASVASYIDLYRPQYAILENVTGMASRTHKQNPLSQLLCAFVGMGYQARVFNLDAWSFGAPQSRSRLFIAITAPGLHILEHPALTHSHPPGTKSRALGDNPNGLTFGERRWDIPVFDFVSARSATQDLPPIDTARIMSIPWPDHRPSRVESEEKQALIQNIPKYARTRGLVGAIARGWVDPLEHSARTKAAHSKAWSRTHPEKLFPTVTTGVCPFCIFTGQWLHWQEDRLVTVQEVRRAQGYPDNEVLIGRPVHQWKIVGNSVARQVALALGLAVREACIRNQYGRSAQILAANTTTMPEEPKGQPRSTPKSSTALLPTKRCSDIAVVISSCKADIESTKRQKMSP
ncbi:BAH domain-containing protein [Trichophyton interdigitale]|nr:BAH domain-containing protein [Trichophyton interdigitale]KAG5217561.1 BAH domain-containing protein [Trichophyton interdigitale]KAG8206037.1 BAH domain-containing protein [Trichophyton interdigitale]